MLVIGHDRSTAPNGDICQCQQLWVSRLPVAPVETALATPSTRTFAPLMQSQRELPARLTLSVPRCLLCYRTYIRTQGLVQVMREVLL